MATNFRYANQTDLSMYYPNFSSYDTKRQVMGWKEGVLNFHDTTVDSYYAHNTGLITNLFFDGAEIDKITFNTLETTKLDGALTPSGAVFDVDASHGLEADDIVKIDNEYIRIVSVSSDTITVSTPGTNRGLFNTSAQHHANDTSVYKIIDASVDLGDAVSAGDSDALSYFYDSDLDLTVIIVGNIDPNDHLIEGGTDNATYFDQMLVNASMELNNLLDARFPMPLPKYDVYDADTSHVTSTTEYDAIIIKMTCYICISNLLRSEFKMEEADYYNGLVTNAEKSGMVDRLNAGEFKLAFEVDSNDSKGKVRTISKLGTMEIVETAGEWIGEPYDVCRITATTSGAYGTAVVKAETYGSDALFGTTKEDIKVTGGLQHIVNGLYVRFQGFSMNTTTKADIWEITVTAGNRKISNPTTGTLDLTRGGSGGASADSGYATHPSLGIGQKP